MGKASLLFVLSASVAGATLLFTTHETDTRAAQTQGAYEADVIAREIARTAFNTASADVNAYGIDIDRAIAEFGERVVSETLPEEERCANGKAWCMRRVGQIMDGTYLVEVSPDGGNGIDVYAQGTFAYDTDRGGVSKTHKINESQSVGVLRVGGTNTSRGGFLRIQFVDSQAGYCSAIFLQRRLPGVPDAEQPLPEMVYPPGKNRNGDRNLGTEVFLAVGTQMNFGIGIDTNCGGTNGPGSRPSSRPDLQMANANHIANTFGRDSLAALMATYEFRESDWANVHWALDASSLSFTSPKEGPWGMVEADPSNDQRWRIAFEDIHQWNLGPDDAGYDNPNLSLSATKRFGYDWRGSFRTKGTDGRGDGWTDEVQVELIHDDPCDPRGTYSVREHTNASDGFHDLRNTGSPADFSDQVIMIEIVPAQSDGTPDYRLPARCSAPA